MDIYLSPYLAHLCENLFFFGYPQGNTVSVLGPHKGLKQVRNVVMDCMKKGCVPDMAEACSVRTAERVELFIAQRGKKKDGQKIDHMTWGGAG